MAIEKRWTTKEVSEVSGYSSWNIQKFAREGRIKGFQTDTGRWRFLESEVKMFLDNLEGKK